MGAPGGAAGRFLLTTLSRRNLARWRHVDTISDLLLSIVVGSASAITIFSARHTSHRRVPHLYGAARCSTSQRTAGAATPCALRSHRCFESAVSEKKCYD